MKAILMLIPFILIPYIIAHIFNRMNYSNKGMTYILCILISIGYSILFDFINISYVSENNTQPACRYPLFLLPIFYSPFLMLLQLLFNKAIIKSIKYDDNDIENKQ